MPEFVEIEAYANTARPLIGGTITGIELRDERLLRRAEEGFDAEAAHVYGVLGGAEIVGVRRIAGIGNLIADEMLFQGKVDPRRTASEIVGDDLDDLWNGVLVTRKRVLERNGSHNGILIQSGSRERGESCPRCDVEIMRVKVGGRTTYFCPAHQH